MPDRLPDQDAPPPSGDTVYRESWARHREVVRAANRARYKAVKRLRAEKSERYAELLAEEATKAGVIPAPIRQQRSSERALLNEIARLEAQLQRMRDEIGGE